MTTHFSVLHIIQTRSVGNPASYRVGISGFFRGVKAAEGDNEDPELILFLKDSIKLHTYIFIEKYFVMIIRSY
jgi:hypothetical protein